MRSTEETPAHVRPRMSIDVETQRGAVAKRLRAEALAERDDTVDDLDRRLAAAHRVFRLLADCEAPPEELEKSADRVVKITRRRADHPDADIAAPRAAALESAARVVAETWGEEEAGPWWSEAAERWLEAADDDGSGRAKELLLRACDAFIGAKRFDRAAGCYARALTLGEDPYGVSRQIHPSRGAHRLKLVVLLLAAGKEADARDVNTLLGEDLRDAFSKRVTRDQFESALDRARALAESSALAGDAEGERRARRGAIDIAVALAKREAKRGGAASSTEDAIRWADEALGDALRTQDDALFLDTYARGARSLLDGALGGLEAADDPKAARASCVRLLFDAGRRFQLLGQADAARECHERAYELSPGHSPPERRPADEMAMSLYLLKGPPADPVQAEVHLKNASALVKALIQAAGVHEDHPSARLRQLALREAFYRRVGDIRKRDEVMTIMERAASEGAAAELEKAAVQYNAGSLAGARESMDQAVSYLERLPGERELMRQALLARSLLFHAVGEGLRPESAAERDRRLARPFSQEALGFDWRKIDRALLQMDPPAEFGRIEELLQFIKGRSPKRA